VFIHKFRIWLSEVIDPRRCLSLTKDDISICCCEYINGSRIKTPYSDIGAWLGEEDEALRKARDEALQNKDENVAQELLKLIHLRANGMSAVEMFREQNGLYKAEDISMIKFEQVYEAYIECALWAGIDKNKNPLDKNYTIHDIDLKDNEEIALDISGFLLDVKYLLDDEPRWTSEQVGHDFYLTRNHHGSGFWDRNLPHVRELTEAAHVYGTSELYPADDGKLYIHH